MLKARTITLVNPKSKRRAASKNPTSLVTLGVVNPKRSVMKKTKKKTAHKRPSKKNPFAIANSRKAAAARKNHRPRKFRSNPSLRGLISKPIELLTAGAFALGGVVTTRQLPQIVLKDKNTGIVGYASNALVAIVLGWGVTKYVGPLHGLATGIGGGAYLVSRILMEQVSPIGKVLSLAGLGDYSAAGNLGAPDIGPLPDNYSPVPNIRNRDGQSINRLRMIEEARQAAMAVAPPVNVSNMSGWGLA